MSSSSLPPRPTKGLPCRSSFSPGPSPTHMTSASRGPVPNTTLCRVSARAHFWQDRQVCSSSSQFVMSILCPPWFQNSTALCLSVYHNTGPPQRDFLIREKLKKIFQTFFYTLFCEELRHRGKGDPRCGIICKMHVVHLVGKNGYSYLRPGVEHAF